jgi:hypothetical protein
MSDEMSSMEVGGDTSELDDSSETELQETEDGAEGATKKPKAPAVPKPKAPQVRKYKIGEEEVSLSDEDIKRDYSKWKASDKAFREAAQARKATEDFMKALQEDPEKILNDKRIPLYKRKLAEKWLLELIDSELNPADPRDAKLSETEKKLKEYEDRDKKAEEDKKSKEYEEAKEKRKTAISQTLLKAMEATHLSADPNTSACVLRELALYMRACKERGEEVTPEELVEHIHNKRFTQFYTLAHQFEGDELIEFLGEEIVNRIRKSDIERIRKSRGGGSQNQSYRDESRAASQPSGTPRKTMDPWQAREHANKVLFGK